LGVFAAALLVSLDYSLSDSLGPGAGFFPFWLSLIGGSLTIAILVQSWRNPDLANSDLSLLSDRAAVMQAGSVLVALGVAAALFEPLGFRLTMLLFIPGLLIALGARSPIPVLLCALAGSFGVFHVFFYWLRVPLPIGVLGI
jgi:hypothetical protein